MHTDTLKMAEKAKILGQILANYRKEKQALILNDLTRLETILHERACYIERLKAFKGEISISPLHQLQKQNIQKIIQEIQKERLTINRLFPS